jgi:hypothetical protein
MTATSPTLENPTKGSTNLGIQQFFRWENYDVIHVSSHGAAIGDQTHCSNIISTGDVFSNAQDLLQITEAGVNTVHFAGDDTRYFGLSADFFRRQYPRGLTRAIVEEILYTSPAHRSAAKALPRPGVS